MHIPGQGFGRVRIKTDQDSRIRFPDLQGQPKASIMQRSTPTNVLYMQKKPETVDAIFCYPDDEVEGM